MADVFDQVASPKSDIFDQVGGDSGGQKALKLAQARAENAKPLPAEYQTTFGQEAAKIPGKMVGQYLGAGVDELKSVGQSLYGSVRHPIDNSLIGTAANLTTAAKGGGGIGLLGALGVDVPGAKQAYAENNIPSAVQKIANPALQIGLLGEAGKAAPAIAKIAGAESNPHAIYKSYLNKIADQPHPMPANVPKPALRAVLRDMEAAGNSEAVDRIKAGTQTAGDLDLARQSTNRLSQSIDKSPGNYPPGLAVGARKFGNGIRNSLYPAMEQANGLPEGSLNRIKALQGDMMQAERNPGLFARATRSVVGGSVGHAVGGPIGAGIGYAAAEPLVGLVDRTIIGARTKLAASKLPPPAAAAPVPSPASSIIDILERRAAASQVPPSALGEDINPPHWPQRAPWWQSEASTPLTRNAPRLTTNAADLAQWLRTHGKPR